MWDLQAQDGRQTIFVKNIKVFSFDLVLETVIYLL